MQHQTLAEILQTFALLFQYFPENYAWSMAVLHALQMGAVISEIDDVCARLLEEGIREFDASLMNLLATIERKAAGLERRDRRDVHGRRPVLQIVIEKRPQHVLPEPQRGIAAELQRAEGASLVDLLTVVRLEDRGGVDPEHLGVRPDVGPSERPGRQPVEPPRSGLGALVAAACTQSYDDFDFTGTTTAPGGTGGTTTRTGDQIDEQLEQIAASVETGIGRSSGSASITTSPTASMLAADSLSGVSAAVPGSW